MFFQRAARPLGRSAAVRPIRVGYARQMSVAAPQLQQQYRSHAEDRLLNHLSRVAAKTHKEGELEQSQELYEHLVHARRNRNGDCHPLTIEAIGSHGAVLSALGEHVAAEHLTREAVTTSTEMLGAMHPETLNQLRGLAVVLLNQGTLDEAESTARLAADGCRTMFGEGAPEATAAEATLGQVLAQKP